MRDEYARALLTRFRKRLSVFVYPLARILAHKCRNPNTVTLTGLAIAMITPLAAWIYPTLLPLLIALSAYMDALDGAIARLTGRVTRFGAVLDSFCDRVEELCYLISLALLGLNALLIIVAIATSYLISYLRALGELRGVKMEGVGLFERGERITVLLIIAALVAFVHTSRTLFIATLILAAMIALNVVTIAQRISHIHKSLQLMERATLSTAREPSSSSRTQV